MLRLETVHLRVGLAASVDDDVQEGWLLADRVTLTALSPPMPITPSQAYTLTAQVQGELAGPAGAVSGQLAAYFYDSQGNLLAVSPIWQATAYSQPTTPLTHRSSVSHPTAVQMRVGLRIAW